MWGIFAHRQKTQVSTKDHKLLHFPDLHLEFQIDVSILHLNKSLKLLIAELLKPTDCSENYLLKDVI